MVASKAPQIFGFVMMVLFLPIIIILAMIVGLLMGMGSAEACQPVQQQLKPLGWPTESTQISQHFSPPDAAGNSHDGVDFAVPKGKKVFAAGDGKIKEISGGQIKIEHAAGKVETWYKFVENPTVTVNQDVKRGDVIAQTGSGTEGPPGSSGDHLHFEWHAWNDEDGPMVPLDPKDQLGDNNPVSTGGCGCSVGPDNLIGANNPQKAFNYLVQAGYKPHQAAGVVGNMQVESTSAVDPTAQFPSKTGISPAQALQNNSQNPPQGRGNAWGIVQWYPASKIIDELRGAGKTDEQIASLGVQLDFLRRQLNNETGAKEKAAGDHLKQTATVEEATQSFGMKYERFTNNPSHPSFAVRIGNAREILRLYGPSAPAQGGGTTNPGGCGAGNGDIVKTALMIAWNTPGHGRTPKPGVDYAQLIAQHNKGAGTYDDYLTDCGVFVATVMKMTGADPDYPARGTSIQYPYLRNSPKYASQTSGEPPPGAIFITDGHVYIYTGPYKGDNGTTYNASSASHHSKVPQATNYSYTDRYGPGGSTRVYTAFYLKNPPATTNPAS